MNPGMHNAGKRPRKKRREHGYVLLTMTLFLALLVIAAAAAAPTIAFQLKRDREEELIHRGVQYSRAIRRYTKKTGRYPLRLEDLRGDGQVRFIRKLYKDPITGGNFRLVHLGDIPPTGAPPNLNGTSSQPSDPSTASPEQDTTEARNNKPDAGAEAESPAGSGLLIFGVASRSRAKSIREFDHKNRYNQWLFFYDPHYDRGQEIKGPTSLLLTAAAPLQPAAPGQTQQPAPPAQQPPDAQEQQPQ